MNNAVEGVRNRHPESRVSSARLAPQLSRLASTLPEVQEGLDAHYALQMSEVAQHLEAIGLPLESAFVSSLLPCRPVVENLEVEVSLLCSIEEQRALGVTLELFGMPAHAFLEARFGSTEVHKDRIKLTVERVPLPSDQHPKEK